MSGRGPGWKDWLGEVVAERARCGEPWVDWDGEAEPERCPPVSAMRTRSEKEGGDKIKRERKKERFSYLVWAESSMDGSRKRKYVKWLY